LKSIFGIGASAIPTFDFYNIADDSSNCFLYTKPGKNGSRKYLIY
jgi:hypothetical protein